MNEPAPQGRPPAPVDGILRRVLALVAALRRAGIGASQSEAIDAVRVLPHVDLLERAQLREALAAATVTSRSQRRVFDEAFELLFPARPFVDDVVSDPAFAGLPDGRPAPAEDRPREDDPDDPDEAGVFLDRLLEQLWDGDDAEVRRSARAAVERFGGASGRDGAVSYYQYKVRRVADPDELLRSLFARAQDIAPNGLDPMEEQLVLDDFRLRVEVFRDEVAADIQRRTVAARGIDQVVDRLVRRPVDELDLVHLSTEDQAELRATLAPLARKLATRMALARRRGTTGRLDVRRTVRRSLSTGGVPFDPVFRPKRPHRPELFVLCDVSGSVAAFAHFTLQLVHALQERFSGVRSFAFIDTLDEVTPLLQGTDVQQALRSLRTDADLVWLDGRSDYGRSLARFHEHYLAVVTPRTTVLVLGDARNNHRQANAWVLGDVHARARHVYWLNPEPVQYWDTGDSIAAAYARFVDEMVEVRTLRQLARFVERLA